MADVVITQADINTAMNLWRISAPAQYQTLLDAQAPKDDNDLERLLLAGALIYFGGQYLSPVTGTIVSYLVVRKTLDDILLTSAYGMTEPTKRLVNGDITIDEWQSEMQKQILYVQIMAAVAARGGLAQMTDADWAALQDRVKSQYEYLDKFAEEIKSKKTALTLALLARAALYADAGIAGFEQARANIQGQSGSTEERYILDPDAIHCDGCIERAGEQWQPLGKLPPLGDEPCGVRDRCTKQYRKPDGNGGWIVSEVE